MTDLNLKIKVNGKYVTVGNVKKNQWGNMSCGLKNTPELIELLSSKATGQWVNLAAFPIEQKEAPYVDEKGVPF